MYPESLLPAIRVVVRPFFREEIQLLAPASEPPNVEYPNDALLKIDFDLYGERIDKQHPFLILPRFTLPIGVCPQFRVDRAGGSGDGLPQGRVSLHPEAGQVVQRLLTTQPETSKFLQVG